MPATALLWLFALLPLPLITPLPAVQTAKAAVALCRTWDAPARLVCLERSADWLGDHLPDHPSEGDAEVVASVLMDLWDRDGVVTRKGLFWLASYAPERLDGRLEANDLMKTSFFWRQAAADMAELVAPGVSRYGEVMWKAWDGPGLFSDRPKR